MRFVAAALLLLLGCGDDTGPLCMEPDPRVPVGETRALTIGDESGPWTDGQEVPLIWGGQGGIMVTPVVRVEGTPAEELEGLEARCVLVTLRNETTVEEASPGGERLRAMERSATGEWQTEPIEDLLGFSPSPFVGQEVTLRVTVLEQDSTFQADGEVTIVLAAPR